MAREIKPKIPKSKLHKAERAMIEGALSGDDVDLAQYAEEGQEKARIRADVLRDLILGRYGPVHERGVRFCNAHISDHLDLANCNIYFSLEFRNSIFGTRERWEKFLKKHKNFDWSKQWYQDIWFNYAAIDINRSNIKFFVIDGSVLYGGINAERAFIKSGIYMNKATLYGPAWLSGITVNGQVAAQKSKFHLEGGASINLLDASIHGLCNFGESEFYSMLFFAGLNVGGI